MATVNFPFEAVDVSRAYNRGVQPMSEYLLEISVSSEGDRKGYREGKRQRNRICSSSWVEVRVQNSKRWKWAIEKVKVLGLERWKSIMELFLILLIERCNLKDSILFPFKYFFLLNS